MNNHKFADRFVIGLVGAPHGLEGFVKIRPFSGDIENLLKLRNVTLRQHGKEQIYAINQSIAAPPFALVQFSGISSPEAAKTLGGSELLVDRSQASPLSDKEFYIEDLKGLAVVSSESNEILGYISDVFEGGADNLVEIKLVNNQSRLVPFRKDFFPEIDPEKGRIVLENLWILE